MQIFLSKHHEVEANGIMTRRPPFLIGVCALITLGLSCAPLPRAPQTTAPRAAPAPVVPAAVAAALPAPVPEPAPAPVALPTPPRKGPSNILVLGDSQISFGAGGPYTAFFRALAQNCTVADVTFPKAQAAAIGVRSTGLHHWTTTQGDARAPLCALDEKFDVNAGSYGVTSQGLSYVQIGQDADYPFCPAGRAALPAAAQALDPDLLVLAFLGNAQERWQSESTVRADWAGAEAQIPPQTACIVMTTIPSFEAQTNARRQQAQTHLASAVRTTNRCAFVAGITPATRTAFEGNADYFRTDDAGRVIDPTHPTASSAEAFTRLITPDLCAAVAQAIRN